MDFGCCQSFPLLLGYEAEQNKLGESRQKPQNLHQLCQTHFNSSRSSSLVCWWCPHHKSKMPQRTEKAYNQGTLSQPCLGWGVELFHWALQGSWCEVPSCERGREKSNLLSIPHKKQVLFVWHSEVQRPPVDGQPQTRDMLHKRDCGKWAAAHNSENMSQSKCAGQEKKTGKKRRKKRKNKPNTNMNHPGKISFTTHSNSHVEVCDSCWMNVSIWSGHG